MLAAKTAMFRVWTCKDDHREQRTVALYMFIGVGCFELLRC